MLTPLPAFGSLPFAIKSILYFADCQYSRIARGNSAAERYQQSQIESYLRIEREVCMTMARSQYAPKLSPQYPHRNGSEMIV